MHLVNGVIRIFLVGGGHGEYFVDKQSPKIAIKQSNRQLMANLVANLVE
jgi:hypothetical protein